MPYSEKNASTFKISKFQPITDLKLLIRDYAVLLTTLFPFPPLSKKHTSVSQNHQSDLKKLLSNLFLSFAFLPTHQPISQNALTILINLSGQDAAILSALATDNAFLESLLSRVTVCQFILRFLPLFLPHHLFFPQSLSFLTNKPFPI